MQIEREKPDPNPFAIELTAASMAQLQRSKEELNLKDAIGVERNPAGVVLLQQRIIGADLFDEAAVAGRVAVGDDDRIVGALLGAATGETDLEHLAYLVPC